MSLTKQLLFPERKFMPADETVNWTRVETLVHGPGTPPWGDERRGDGNSAVFACLMAIAMSVPEPPVRVYRTNADGNNEWLEGDPLQALLDAPTPAGELSPKELWFWVAWALHTDGNAYLLKTRSGNKRTGNVVQLWPASPSLIAPITERESDDWISYYSLQVGPNEWQPVNVANVVHFRLGIDDRDMRRGLSPLKRLARQISTDEEADRFTDTLLKNYAVPGLVVKPANGGLINPDDAERIKKSFDRKFGNDRRGNTAVLSKDTDVMQFGYSPEQMNLSVLHRIPEERIAAVMGVPAIIAGLGAGLDRATYSNFREAREMFTETKLVPLWAMLAEKLNASLLPDFHSDPAVTIAHDLTDVRALQEDEDRKYARLNIGVQGARPWITVNEARADVGLPPVDGGDELVAPALSPPPRLREEDRESDDEAELTRENGQAGVIGGANGHAAPFRPTWEGYP
jgi:HK97 family phage portal protein